MGQQVKEIKRAKNAWENVKGKLRLNQTQLEDLHEDKDNMKLDKYESKKERLEDRGSSLGEEEANLKQALNEAESELTNHVLDDHNTLMTTVLPNIQHAIDGLCTQIIIANGAEDFLSNLA